MPSLFYGEKMRKLFTTFTIALSLNAFAEDKQEVEVKYNKLLNSEFIHKESKTTKLEVFYFFSYGCPYCYQLSPYLDIYLKSIDKTKVSFYYKPLKIQDAWEEYAKAYYVAEGLEKDIYKDIFNKVHKKGEKIFSKEELGDYFHKEHSVSYPDFNSAYNSYLVNYKIKKNEKLADSFNVTGTPTLVFVDHEQNVYKMSPSINSGIYNLITSAVVLSDNILNKSTEKE